MALACNATSMASQIVKPFLLRRTKEEVDEHLRLPDKSEVLLYCGLTGTLRGSEQSMSRRGPMGDTSQLREVDGPRRGTEEGGLQLGHCVSSTNCVQCDATAMCSQPQKFRLNT